MTQLRFLAQRPVQPLANCASGETLDKEQKLFVALLIRANSPPGLLNGWTRKSDFHSVPPEQPKPGTDQALPVKEPLLKTHIHVRMRQPQDEVVILAAYQLEVWIANIIWRLRYEHLITLAVLDEILLVAMCSALEPRHQHGDNNSCHSSGHARGRYAICQGKLNWPIHDTPLLLTYCEIASTYSTYECI